MDGDRKELENMARAEDDYTIVLHVDTLDGMLFF